MKKKPVIKKYVEFNNKFFTEYGRTVSIGYDFIFAVDILITDCFSLGGAKKVQQYVKLMDTASTEELLINGLKVLGKKVPVSKKVEKMLLTAVNKQESLEAEFMIKPKWKTVKSREENTKVVNKYIEALKKLGENFEAAEDAVADLLEAIEKLNQK